MKQRFADNSELMGGDEAAGLLGIRHRTLADWRKHRGLPYLRITAKEIRYRRSDLLAWLESFRRGGAR